MGGLIAAGCMYLLLATLVKVRGTNLSINFCHQWLSAVIIIIGLGLAPTAVNMALGKTGDGAALVEHNIALTVSLASLLTTIAVAIWAKGLLKLMPILAGIIVGYGLSLYFGIIDFTKVPKLGLRRQTLLLQHLTGMPLCL